MPMGRSYWVTFVSGFQKYLSPLSGSNKASHGGGNVGSCCLCGAMVLENMQSVLLTSVVVSVVQQRRGSEKEDAPPGSVARVWGKCRKHGDCKDRGVAHGVSKDP